MSEFKNAKVLVTGHSGFKGSWLTFVLKELGAKVTGYSLSAPSDSRHVYYALEIEGRTDSGGFKPQNIEDYSGIHEKLSRGNFDYIFHLAAQPLVSQAFLLPRQTFLTNAIGTVNLLEAIRSTSCSATAVFVTSDKAYLNLDNKKKFVESDELGGVEAYSGSKAAAEIAIQAYFRSYPKEFTGGLSSARGGNVFGGGDWSENRIVPDIMRSIAKGEPFVLRKPSAIRPWTYVLDIISGYLKLAVSLRQGRVGSGEAWNFSSDETLTAYDLAAQIARSSNTSIINATGNSDTIVEPNHLQISNKKSKTQLNWQCGADLPSRLEDTAKWYRLQFEGGNVLEYSLKLLDEMDLP